MPANTAVILSRDCEGAVIPSGARITLPAGERVQITQSLGGSYTVIYNGLLARIADQDADAIGATPPLAPADPAGAAADGQVDEKLVMDRLRTCYDPEIPVNIVELGLIYDCRITPMADGECQVDVKMTLTAPGCGMGEVIASDVQSKILNIPRVAVVNVDLVWDPPWSQAMMSDAAKLELGLM
jgi:probable FeS assembly SUF system protein SufT